MTTETQPMPTDAERAEFERRMGGANFKRNADGNYVNEFVQCKWWGWCAHADAVREIGWQAARRTPAPVGVEPAFYTVFAKFEGAPIPLAQYSASSETGVLERVMDAARKEGYTGHPQDRMTELGWVVGPVYAAPQSLAMERVPLEEWHVRGQLAASLTCWHRLTDNEAAELVAFVTGVAPRHQARRPAWR